MPEKIMMRLNKDFEGGFWAVDPTEPDSDEYKPVQAFYEITPYGMLLSSLAGCTAQIVHTFANNHGIDLDEIELQLDFHHRGEQPEYPDQEGTPLKEDKITQKIRFNGNLSDQDAEKLFQVAHHCPIEHILEEGIIIKSQLNKD